VDSGGPKEACICSSQWRNLANTIEPSICGGDAAFLSNYFDHLFEISVDSEVTECVLADNTYDRSDSVWRALMRTTLLCSRTEFQPGEERVPILRRLVGSRVCHRLALTVTRLQWRFYGRQQGPWLISRLASPHFHIL